MNIKELKEILQLLDENDVTEFELEEGGMKLRVRMASAGASAPAGPSLATPPVPAVVSGLAPATPPSAPTEPPAVPAPAVEDEGLVLVKSPIVGTFFRAPDPNAAPFVNVGDHVRPGQVLCIVEAMKLMNEIEAEAGGTVMKIHPESGQPVQFGDPLFTMRPD